LIGCILAIVYEVITQQKLCQSQISVFIQNPFEYIEQSLCWKNSELPVPWSNFCTQLTTKYESKLVYFGELHYVDVAHNVKHDYQHPIIW